MSFLQRSDEQLLDEAIDDLKRPFAIDKLSRAHRTTCRVFRVMALFFLAFVLMDLLERLRLQEYVLPFSLKHVAMVCLGIATTLVAIAESKKRSDLRLLKIVERLRSQPGDITLDAKARGAAQPPA